MSSLPSPLSTSEIQALRAKAQRESLSPEEVAKFVAATRVSYLALPAKKSGKKKKEGEAPAPDVDFF